MALVAPEAGAATASLLYMALALVAFLGYIVARGLIATWTHSIGYLLNWLGGELSFKIPTGFSHITVDLGHPFLEADRLVLTALQNWAAGLEAETAYFFHGSATLAEWTIGQVSGLADDTADAFDWLIHTHLPRISLHQVSKATLAAMIAKMIADALPKTWSTVTKVVHVVEHEVTHTITKVVAAAGAIAIPGPFALPGFRHLWHDLTSWRTRIGHRVGRLEKLLGVTGLAALITATFGAEITRFLRCKNTRGIAKAWCGSDLASLLGLLGGLAAIEAGFSIVAMAEEMLSIESQMVKLIGGAFSELDGITG